MCSSDLGLSVRTRSQARAEREQAWADFETCSRPFADRRRLVDRRLSTALGWLVSPEALALLPDAATRGDDVLRLSRALGSLAAKQPEWIRLTGFLHALEVWFQHASNEEIDDASRKAIETLFGQAATELRSIRAALVDEPYPLEHADPTMTLGRYLLPEPVSAWDSDAVYGAASRLRSLFPWLAWQLVGRLVLQAEAAEAALGLASQEPPPAPGPPDAVTKP